MITKTKSSVWTIEVKAEGAETLHTFTVAKARQTPHQGIMIMGDLLSLRQLELPVKLIVFDNSALGFVELEMKAAGILDFATELHNPDFAKMAEAAGVLGLKANVPEQVRPLIAQALSHPGPALVEVVVNRQELIVPPSVKFGPNNGFQSFHGEGRDQWPGYRSHRSSKDQPTLINGPRLAQLLPLSLSHS